MVIQKLYVLSLYITEHFSELLGLNSFKWRKNKEMELYIVETAFILFLKTSLISRVEGGSCQLIPVSTSKITIPLFSYEPLTGTKSI